MRLFFIASVAFLWTFSVNAKDVSKADSEQNKAHDAQTSPEGPSTRIEINVGNQPATPSQPQERNSRPETTPAPITHGEWLIAGITAVYAIISYLAFANHQETG
jgi:hypothetical protein